MPLEPSGVPSRAGIQLAIDEAVAGLAAKVQRGREATPAIAAGTAAPNAAITFPVPFESTPTVVATAETGRLTLGIFNVTTTGCLISVANWSPDSAPASGVNWIAVGI